ncbi:DUF4503 domain-containing protein [Caerostris extrusa]|uniref:DUF4503 domain-containing protein n=1 Tax=Caerostris extrusa TaxID=172846 RepID=A0AAV4V7W4_CAEEX|nr:DUF4503 domain-containing protein [Caerostris extrusa]
MNNTVNEGLPCNLPFLNFRTKQNVSKARLGKEFAKEKWNVFSSGFLKHNSQESLCSLVQETSKLNEQKSTADLKTLRKQTLSEECKAKKRKPVIEPHEIEFFTQKAKSLCNFAHEKNKLQSKLPKLKKCANAVFLEVQNTESSFQQDKLIPSKPAAKISFEFSKNFSSKHEPKINEGQENVPKRSKLSDYSFILPSESFLPSVTIRKVKKSNIFSSLPSTGEKNVSFKNNDYVPSTADYKLPLASCESKISNGVQCIKDLKFCLTGRKVVAYELNHNEKSRANSSINIESSKSKGSSWLQSLQLDPALEREALEKEDSIVKRKIRNILPGGFAEQMLKFQRREKSEKVIWDHNIDISKKKAVGNSLLLKLVSVSRTNDIFVAKCVSLPLENHAEDFSFENKKVKLQLKIQSIFQVYPPWQTIHLSSISSNLSCPVILCANFIDFNSLIWNPSKKRAYQDKQISIPTPVPTSLLFEKKLPIKQNNENPFFLWEEPVSLSGRIQRIWEIKISYTTLSAFTNISNYYRYSILVQGLNNTFYELIFYSLYYFPNVWKDFISNCQGKCYQFHNLRVSQKLCLKRYPQLYRILESLKKQLDNSNEANLNQDFCYQLMLDCTSGVPEAICDKGFPSHCPARVEPLSKLFKKSNNERFTCIGKVLFEYQRIFCISDESLRKSSKYVQLEFLFPQEANSLVGSVVLIEEALFCEGLLLIDNYSKLIRLSEDLERTRELKLLHESRLKQIELINLQNIIPPITTKSLASEFAIVRGKIISIDENNALSWLQCNSCLGENLVQDANLVIYCEDCSCIVPRPILNVRMTACCQCTPSTRVHIQLLSNTIKRILQISDDTHRPRCNVRDILGKKIGPLFCFIRSCRSLESMVELCVSEVTPS